MMTSAQAPFGCSPLKLFPNSKEYGTEAEFDTANERPEIRALPAWERLRHLFATPASKARYDAQAPLRTLFNLQGTAVAACLWRPEFWLLFAFHVLISVLYYKVYGNTAASGVAKAQGWPAAHMSLVGIPGTLLVFALVFYIDRTYKRYHAQYQHCKGISTTMGEVLMHMRALFRDSAFEEARPVRVHLCKLLNAAHALIYAGLLPYRSIGVHFWTFQYLEEKELLSPGQVAHVRSLMESGPDGRLAFKEVLNWVLRSIWVQHWRDRMHPRVVLKLSLCVFEMAGHADRLYEYSTGPVPFPYHHHIHFILLGYLFLLAYTFAFQTAYYTIPAYFLIALAFISARELGDMLSDPFGDDHLDLPVFDFVEGIRKESMGVIERTPASAARFKFMTQDDDTYYASLSHGGQAGTS